MSTDLLPKLLRALDLAVVERMAHSRYALAAPAPAWLAGAVASEQSLLGVFPFLEHVLTQAESVWHRGDQAKTDSGPFEATVNGDALLLRATALTIDGRHLIVVERLTGSADLRPTLQRARQQALAHEVLVRDAIAVRAPANDIAGIVKALAALELPAEARALVDRLTESTTAMQEAVSALPDPPPRGRHARRPARRLKAEG